MRVFQQLQKFVSKRISEVRKRSRVASFLLICFSVLVIFNLHISTTSVASIYEQYSNALKSVDSSQAQSLFAELRSEFVKQSCLSRYQSSSYRKNQTYNINPSPYLISKLRDYQKLHAQCGPHSSSYRRFIQSISTSSHEKQTTSSSCKYLVWTPANGLGNRIESITAAFLYSLLESRVLLVDFQADMNDLFCEPFPKSSWLLPNDFPYRNNWDSLPSFEYKANLSNEDISSSSPSIIHLKIQHWNGDSLLRQFHCTNTQILLQKIPVLILLSDQYFIPSLFMSSIFNSELNKMFPKKGVIFHILSHYLFNPSNEAWGLITKFYDSYLANSDQIIGLQIRAFTSSEYVPYENIMSQIKSCVIDNNILPSPNSNVSSNIIPSQNQTSNSIAVLVASLYPEFSERLRSMYLSSPTVNGDVIRVHQPSHEANQKFNDKMHNMKAWVEIYLLSLCDSLVTSGYSTFGYVARGLGGSSNSWIMKRMDGTENISACKRVLSPEPCFHRPATHSCDGKNKIENINAVNSNLYICEEVGYGIKLVDR